MNPKNLLKLLAILTATVHASADMHHMDEMITTTSSQSIDMSTVTPIAHEAHHLHGVRILDTNLSPAERLYWENYNTTTYFTIDSPHKASLYIHLCLIVTAFVFLYPIVLILNNLNSNWFLPALALHLVLCLVSLLNYSIFISNAPDLYPNNVYKTFNVIMLFLLLIHFVNSILYISKKYHDNLNKHVPLKQAHDDDLEGNGGTSSPSSTLFEFDNNLQRIPSNSFDLDEMQSLAHSSSSASNSSNSSNSTLVKIFNNSIVMKLVESFGSISKFSFNLLNYGLLFYFFAYLPTGLIVFNCLGKGNRIFNLLAHVIKGAVFAIYGCVALIRYLGGFEKLGLAWNYSFISKFERSNSLLYRIQPKGSMITMELVESSLMLFYGVTNVFLEHLAAPGGAWTAKDLQHVSIAFMYIGGGLCGVITELKLASWRTNKFYSKIELDSSSSARVDLNSLSNVTPGFSPNPFPLFTVFWTGFLMSKHAQASELSTLIHTQWGSLLCYAAGFRFLTILLYTYKSSVSSSSSNDIFKPTRPITELLTSFCLISGGFIFMESTDQVVESMEYYGLTSMFTLNVSVGIISLLMSWIMVVFSFKDWLKKKMSV